jgi:dipeptidyl aminopeptidase/acylaminoacyl peptidase
MNKAAFLSFLAVVFVSALIFTPLFNGWFVHQDYDYYQEKVSETRTTVSYKIIYESDGVNIHALLTIPKTPGKVPVFVIFPAASITKEAEQNHLGNELNRLGFATFILDPRGSGSSGGQLLPPEYDYFTYFKGVEGPYPTQWKAVDDLFRAYEIVSNRPELDPERIYVAGESMGGRYAIIAASLQDGFNGTLVISSSGYNADTSSLEPELADYMDSINPYTYIKDLKTKIAFMHGTDDEILPIEDGLKLYDAANEPKKFYEVEGGGHSFESMDHSSIDEVVEWLTS